MYIINSFLTSSHTLSTLFLGCRSLFPAIKYIPTIPPPIGHHQSVAIIFSHLVNTVPQLPLAIPRHQIHSHCPPAHWASSIRSCCLPTPFQHHSTCCRLLSPAIKITSTLRPIIQRQSFAIAFPHLVNTLRPFYLPSSNWSPLSSPACHCQRSLLSFPFSVQYGLLLSR